MKQANNLPAFEAGTVRRLLEGVTVTLGEIREISLHPSGVRFDGPAVVVGAFTNPVFGLGLRDTTGRRFDNPPLGAFVKLVSLSDPSRRVVTCMIAATPPSNS